MHFIFPIFFIGMFMKISKYEGKFGFKNNFKRISGTFQDYDSMDDKIDPLYYYICN